VAGSWTRVERLGFANSSTRMLELAEPRWWVVRQVERLGGGWLDNGGALCHRYGMGGWVKKYLVMWNYVEEQTYNLWGMSTMAHPPQMSSHCQGTGVVKDALYCLASQLWLVSLGHGGWLSMLVVVVLGKVIKNLMLSSSSNMHMNQNHVTSKMLTTRLFNSIPDPSIEDIDKEAHSMARGMGGMTRGGGGPSCLSSKLVVFHYFIIYLIY